MVVIKDVVVKSCKVNTQDMYILKITNNSLYSRTKKLIIEHQDYNIGNYDNMYTYVHAN